MRALYRTRVLHIGNNSVIWLVVAETVDGAEAGIQALRERAVIAEFSPGPISPRLRGGVYATGRAVFPGYGASLWEVETEDATDLSEVV